ncbi:MAG: hypothetical protein LBG67_00230 [Campylobacteraceae bacterium]|nr:hypothetical protein [Campylobacteraceae bacterium]
MVNHLLQIQLYHKIQKNVAKNTLNPVQEYLNSRGIGKQLQKEQRGIYNVTFNGKNATEVRKADGEIIKYKLGNKDGGAKHIIRRHIGNGKYGEVTDKELLQMGEIVRNGKIIDKVKTKNDGSINYGYELYKDGIRFRVIINKKANDEKIVSMFSDRLPSEAGRHAQFKSSPVEDIIPQNTENVAKNLYPI